MGQIKLLAVDMDGTCLDKISRMTEKTVEALWAARKAGIQVVPATGRCLSCLPRRLVKEEGLFRYVISSNGAEVTDWERRKNMFHCRIDWESAADVLKACRGEKLAVAAHVRHRYLVQGRALAFVGRAAYGRDADGLYCVRDLEQYVRNTRCEIEELQFYFLSGTAKGRIEKILEERPSLTAAYTGHYVEIFSSAVSKGTALSALAGRLGISKKEIACIGDGENDLPMFGASGYRLAMGNAAERLKEKADAVLPGNGKEGAAFGVRNYILPRA